MLLALSLALALSAGAAEPLPVPSTVRSVTVYPGSALVRRTADAPAGGGTFVLEGLPWSMDPSSVRVRCFGAEVVSTETRERIRTAVPDERVQELRRQLGALEREETVLQSELEVLVRLERHVERLLELEENAHSNDVRGGRADPDVWSRNFEFLSTKLTENATGQREVRWKLQEKKAQIADVRLQLGRIESSESVYLRDVLVEVVAQDARGAVIDLEYLVGSAGWQPRYDLRTAPDARSVELVYRAEVWQQSGEDWNDVELALSTSRPQRGAQAPEPRPIWARLVEPSLRKGYDDDMSPRAALQELGYSGGDEADTRAAPARAFAEVQNRGLSVRFVLPNRDSVESRTQPTTVLIGKSRFEVEPEYHAVPALDDHVWLRGRATNESQWVLLPGRAAVYFAGDFIGHADLPATQTGAEILLHLGADPGLSLERILVEDLRKGPGVFGSRATDQETWRIQITNDGAAAADPDGSALVHVREALPRATDDRIKVELSKAVPPPSTDERWRADREEKGILTWSLRVPAGGEAGISFQVRTSYPDGMRVVR